MIQWVDSSRVNISIASMLLGVLIHTWTWWFDRFVDEKWPARGLPGVGQGSESRKNTKKSFVRICTFSTFFAKNRKKVKKTRNPELSKIGHPRTRLAICIKIGEDFQRKNTFIKSTPIDPAGDLLTERAGGRLILHFLGIWPPWDSDILTISMNKST